MQYSNKDQYQNTINTSAAKNTGRNWWLQSSGGLHQASPSLAFKDLYQTPGVSFLQNLELGRSSKTLHLIDGGWKAGDA